MLPNTVIIEEEIDQDLLSNNQWKEETNASLSLVAPKAGLLQVSSYEFSSSQCMPILYLTPLDAPSLSPNLDRGRNPRRIGYPCFTTSIVLPFV